MPYEEIDELEFFADVDDLLRQVARWGELTVEWGPLNRSQALLSRLMPRLDALRIRLEAPLVVATFGGTGTGKSALVNALVGREVTRSGRERPTTRRPVLLKHSQAELELLGLPLDEFDVQAVDAPVLRDVVLIDCPDPDTNEAADAGTNLSTLRRLLPHCDVLIFTASQQKYRSARVLDELDVAATGCRLLFVQTHADQDVDIRDDWRTHLSSRFAVPEMFFVDSVRALREQMAGQRPSGDFARLQDQMSSRLAARDRVLMRRANLLDLLEAGLQRCTDTLSASTPAVRQLEIGWQDHQQRLTSTMSASLQGQLELSRNLWEQRLLGAVTSIWGVSPFSSLLRLYHGLGALIASASLARARSTAQLVLIGAMHGTKWLADRQREREAEQRFDASVSLGVSDAQMQEARVILAGYLRDAQLPASLLDDASMSSVREETAQLATEFLQRAREQVEEIIQRIARRNTGWFARMWYECLFLAYIGYVLYRAGRAFFYDSIWEPQRLVTTDFYVNAAIFFALWSSCLVIAFCRRLRRGLQSEVRQLAAKLAEERLGRGLFPQLGTALSEAQQKEALLRQLLARCQQLRQQLAHTPGFGGSLP